MIKIAGTSAVAFARRSAAIVSQRFRLSFPLSFRHGHLQHRSLQLSQIRFGSEKESDYLHHSSVPTMFFQDHLPPLPRPTLQESCRRFIESLSPLVSEQEKETAKRLVSEFSAGVGKELQDKLDSLPPTFAQDYCIRGRVLASRDPLPCFGALGIEFPLLRGFGKDMQIPLAATTVRACIRFANTLRANKLHPEFWEVKPHLEKILSQLQNSPKPIMYEGKRGLPMSMTEYSVLFNSCQIARVGKDEVRTFEDSKHILVMRNGHIYTADVIDKDGRLASTSQIYQQLQQIVDETNSLADIPVAVLTTTERDDCARAMEMLRAKNEKSLKLVESAMFVLSLDDGEAHTGKEVVEAIQFGDGGNRWFGKSINFVVGKSGYIELSQAARIEDESRDFAKNSISCLNFVCDPDLVSELNEAKKKFSLLRGDRPFHQVICNDFDYALIKERNLSPDSIVKLTAQLAFYTMRMRLPVATDVASTAFYKDGQSAESMIVTQDSAAFVNAVANEGVGDKKRLFDLLTAASLTNQMRIFDTMQGKMFNYHFMTLEYLAEELGKKVPLFESKLYGKATMNEFIIYPTDFNDDELNYLPFANMQDNRMWEVCYAIGRSSGKLSVVTCFVDAAEYLSHIKSGLSTIMDVIKNGAQ
ncbi:carnitine O-palmitoyltransferase 2, mitochondrial-like isoform X2 [Corticium candelabrum]|uniref:carnitine O-palmitoyltransferase 2, mitochondrial-like isoform X2 n=1 Tax=Corticium candelabrum TaxID=121492 RepID=UPI002E262345|nr:carnitine O-palmitoyltransferase 2, mitochondrial-like isoform X2 [Corticium candelabrum]